MRERGFVVEVTAFLPAGETDVAAMSEAAQKLDGLADWFHANGFSAVAVSSKFTSRKVEGPAPLLDTPTEPQKLGDWPLETKITPHPLDIPASLDRRAKPAGDAS